MCFVRLNAKADDACRADPCPNISSRIMRGTPRRPVARFDDDPRVCACGYARPLPHTPGSPTGLATSGGAWYAGFPLRLVSLEQLQAFVPVNLEDPGRPQSKASQCCAISYVKALFRFTHRLGCLKG
jgi:hypothetical protein